MLATIIVKVSCDSSDSAGTKQPIVGPEPADLRYEGEIMNTVPHTCEKASPSWRFALVVEYEGSAFAGWQWQPGLASVQQVLQDALYRLTQQHVTLAAAGRTDRGVHSLGQVVHGQLDRPLSLDALRRGLNFYLKGAAVQVVQAYVVDRDFHARFSAIGRAYVYAILNRPSATVLWRGRCWWIPQILDVRAMVDAAHYLHGTHDFSSFRHKDCQSQSPVRTLDVLTVERRGPWVLVHAQARSFLHRQVRMMVGALVHVGRGKWPPSQVQTVLQARQSLHGAMTAPACGLYFTKALYPECVGIGHGISDDALACWDIAGENVR